MPDALPDATLPISRLGTGSTNGSNNGRGWGLKKTDKHSLHNVNQIYSKDFFEALLN
jgi:hypothetical protein